MAPPSPLPWWPLLVAVGTTALVVAAFAFTGRYVLMPTARSDRPLREVARKPESPWIYRFSTPGILEESAAPEESTSPFWWLDSGGRLIVARGVGSTLQGELPYSDPWRKRYAETNPRDTDGGAHPQNVFRLISRASWENARVEAAFRIGMNSDSASENRNESNGIFLMTRYRNQNNLYYAGLRVDGHAVIKKKRNGVYTTLSEKQYLPGEYARASSTNPLPLNEWIVLRVETETRNDAVHITLFKKEGTGWLELASTTDSESPHTGSFPIGIRTDFMDVEFDTVRIEAL